MKKFFFDCGTRDATASLGLLALRVLTGLMMIVGHGIPKIKNYEVNKNLFPIPDFFPMNLIGHQMSLNLCIMVEVGAAALVILGIATRPAAFILAFTMVVAAFNYLGGAPWFQNSPTLVETKELAILYIIPMIAIILAGAGSYSVDAAVHLKDSKRRRW